MTGAFRQVLAELVAGERGFAGDVKVLAGSPIAVNLRHGSENQIVIFGLNWETEYRDFERVAELELSRRLAYDRHVASSSSAVAA